MMTTYTVRLTVDHDEQVSEPEMHAGIQSAIEGSMVPLRGAAIIDQVLAITTESEGATR